MKFNRKKHQLGATALFTLLFAFSAAEAQVDHEVIEDDYDEASANVQPYVLLSVDEIEDLVGPIALYPDDLVSIILPASTYPVQVVQAARFLQDREGNPDLEPPGDWDDAVVALLNYPEVIDMMNDDLDWTWALGDAFLNQQSEVLSAVSEFRDQAYAAGNLKSDEHQVVRRTERVIEIVPADPEVIYVPYYEPARVIVYQRYPVYHYHPYPRYSYYYPYPAHYGFSYGYFFGVSTAFRLHWVNHRLYTYNYGYLGHPYFGRSYHNRFYYRHRPFRDGRRLARSQGGYVNRGHQGDRWRPRRGHGPRPQARAESRGRTGIASQSTRSNSRTNTGARNLNSPTSRFAAIGSTRGQNANARRAYSDKNPDQRRTVQRYREQARTDSVPGRARNAGSRLPSTTAKKAAATSRSPARSSDRSARRGNQDRATVLRRLAGSENARDVATRTRPRLAGNTSERGSRQVSRNVAVNARPSPQSARPAATRSARPPVASTRVAPQRRSAQQQASRAPAQSRQAQRSAPPASRAKQARSEPRQAPARSKQRAAGGRRSEPRRR